MYRGGTSDGPKELLAIRASNWTRVGTIVSFDFSLLDSLEKSGSRHVGASLEVS